MDVEVLNVNDSFILWIGRDFDLRVVENGIDLECFDCGCNCLWRSEEDLCGSVGLPGKPAEHEGSTDVSKLQSLFVLEFIVLVFFQ